MLGSEVARPPAIARLLAPLVVLLGGALSCSSDSAGQPAAASGPVFGTSSPDLAAPPFPTGLTQATCTDDPTRDGVGIWKPISLDGAPVRPGITVWTGSEVVSVDVSPNYAGTVKAYDPVLDEWRDLSPPDPSYLSRYDPFLGAVGGTLVFYGGYQECPDCTSGFTQFLNDGWTVDLASGVWTPMQPGPALATLAASSLPVFGAGAKALFILDIDPNVTVATYDLPSGAWQTAAGPANGTSGGECERPAWNGQQAICQELLSDGLATITPDPVTWAPFPTLVALPQASPMVEFTPVGDKYFALAVPNLPPYDDESEYLFMVDPIAQTWSDLVSVPRAGVDRRAPTLLATIGGRVVIWGGAFSMKDLPDLPGQFRNDGIILDPSTNTWSSVTCVGAPPPPHAFASVVATGSGFIVFENDLYTGMAGSAILEL